MFTSGQRVSLDAQWRAYCIMSRRVLGSSQVNAGSGSRSESESEEGEELLVRDPKPSELSMVRLQPP